jgi:integrase
MSNWVSTKFPGVRYKESEGRKYKGRAERYFAIRYKRHGRPVEEGLGWESSGITGVYCNQIRGQILHNIRIGTDYQSLAEKRELEEGRRQKKADEKEVIDKENTPFDHIATQYLEWAESSKKSWKGDVSRYQFHIKTVLGQKPVKDISVIALESLKKSLQKKKVKNVVRTKGKPKLRESKVKTLSPATVRHVIVLIRQIYNWAINRGLFTGENPVRQTAKADKKFLKMPDNKRVRFLSRSEAKTLLDSLLEKKRPLSHDLALISLYAGLRMGEIFRLKFSDLDFQHDLISVKDPKSGEGRTAYMTKPIKEVLKRRYQESESKVGLVFLNAKAEQVKGMPNAFNNAVKELGFNKGVTDRRDKVVAHSLRHSFGSWLATAGTPLPGIQKLMGHKTITATMIYAHLSPSVERQAAVDLAEWSPTEIVDIESRKKK